MTTTQWLAFIAAWFSMTTKEIKLSHMNMSMVLVLAPTVSMTNPTSPKMQTNRGRHLLRLVMTQPPLAIGCLRTWKDRLSTCMNRGLCIQSTQMTRLRPLEHAYAIAMISVILPSLHVVVIVMSHLSKIGTRS